MRSRGQGVLAAVLAGSVVVGGLAVDRWLPRRERPQASGGEAASGSWICPHGGGEGWRATLFLANPSQRAATAHLTDLDRVGGSFTEVVDVPPTSTVRVDVEAQAREASTFVETFGPWIAAGWVTQGGGSERGTGAEPCAPGGARRWYVADGNTQEGEDGFLVIANPYQVDAVVDVSLYAQGRPPVRDSELTNLTIGARASVAIRLGAHAAGEAALGALVQARIGRVGVAGVGVGASGIRSSVGTTSLGERAILPGVEGVGGPTVSVLAPGLEPAAFGMTRRSSEQPEPVEGLIDVEQEPQSAAIYRVLTSGASAVEIGVHNDQPIAAAERLAGAQGDAAATAGSVAVAAAWVVLPAADADPSASTIVLVNPGAEDVSVELEELPVGGGVVVALPPLVIPAGGVTSVDAGAAGVSGAVVVRSEGEIVALRDAPPGGGPEPAGFALSVGVPMELTGAGPTNG